jgi:hypothetical protein
MVTFIYKREYISRKCQRLALFLKRNLYRKHDFLFLIQKLKASSVLTSVAFVLDLFFFYHIVALHYWRYWFVQYYLTRIKCLHLQNYLSELNSGISNLYIGGGLNSFSLEEIQPYAIKDFIWNTNVKFKFKCYILESESDLPKYAHPPLNLCNIP